MRATIPFVKKVYEEYNQKCFGGILPTPEYRISNTKRIFGNVRWWHKHDEKGEIIAQSIGLSITRRYDTTEDRMIDIILHEMIHIYIIAAKIPITAMHGNEFIKVMNDINEKYCRHVEVHKAISWEELNSDTVREPHYLCYLEFSDGRAGVLAFSVKCVKKLKDFISRRPDITKYEFWYTDDPFFNRFWVHSSFKNIGLWTENPKGLLKQKKARRVRL